MAYGSCRSILNHKSGTLIPSWKRTCVTAVKRPTDRWRHCWKDLKQRGLFESTLVVWGGEFGRLPLSQSRGTQRAGRDHGPTGFSVWMAGGGTKGGTLHGSTDDIGYRAVENRVSVHDFHATILHLLGMNHRDLVYVREGRNERLTDEFPARVVKEILA